MSSGQEKIYARRSLHNRLNVSPADYDTSPHFGNSSPRYTIKAKYPQKQLEDNKDYPDHLEPNDMPSSPSYTISEKYKDKVKPGAGYEFFPNNFGADSNKKSIGEKLPVHTNESYGSPDQYNTREDMGIASPRYSIGTKLKPAWLPKCCGGDTNGVLGDSVSPGPQYDSYQNFHKSVSDKAPSFTINDNKRTERKIQNFPGPGQYNVTVRPDFSTVKVTIGEKTKDQKRIQVPGPDEHANQAEWGAVTRDYNEEKRQSEIKAYSNMNRFVFTNVGSANNKDKETGALNKSRKVKVAGFTIGEKFKERGKDHNEGIDYVSPPKEMGFGSPRTGIRVKTGETWITKSSTPGPGAYAPEKVPLPSQKYTIKEKRPELRGKEPVVEYKSLPELPRGRQCTIGNKETMEFVG